MSTIVEIQILRLRARRRPGLSPQQADYITGLLPKPLRCSVCDSSIRGKVTAIQVRISSPGHASPGHASGGAICPQCARRPNAELFRMIKHQMPDARVIDPISVVPVVGQA